VPLTCDGRLAIVSLRCFSAHTWVPSGRSLASGTTCNSQPDTVHERDSALAAEFNSFEPGSSLNRPHTITMLYP